MYATLCGEILVSRVSKGIENRRPIARARSTAPYNLSLFACDIFGIRSILFSTARLTSAISGKEMSRLIGDPDLSAVPLAGGAGVGAGVGVAGVSTGVGVGVAVGAGVGVGVDVGSSITSFCR